MKSPQLVFTSQQGPEALKQLNYEVNVRTLGLMLT